MSSQKRVHPDGDRLEHRRQRSVGVKDIAEASGVSIATVDRALHNRGRISQATRERILRIAEALGYQPNLAARYLKKPKALRISIHLPAEIALFWDKIRSGIEEAAKPFDMAVSLSFKSHPKLGEGETVVLEQALTEGVRGIIMAPGHPAELREMLRRASELKIPVVYVSTDAPGTERLTTVSVDHFTSGAIAGELFHKVVSQEGSAAVITGDLLTVDHADKLRGFKYGLKLSGDRLRLTEVIEARDDEELAYQATVSLVRRDPKLKAIYVSTANSLGVIRALEDVDQEDRVALITTDLFPEMVPLIQSGKIVATIHQRPKTQGKIAFEALYRYLTEGVHPPPRIRLTPHIIFRSNLSLFAEDLN